MYNEHLVHMIAEKQNTGIKMQITCIKMGHKSLVSFIKIKTHYLLCSLIYQTKPSIKRHKPKNNHLPQYRVISVLCNMTSLIGERHCFMGDQCEDNNPFYIVRMFDT
jgi:hypothetical protein